MSRQRKRASGRRGGEPTALSDLVRSVYPGRDGHELESLHAFRWWFRAVPARVHQRALPVRLRNGVLTVHVANSTWASELSFLKDTLLASVGRHAPHLRVRDLRFKVGPLPQLRRPGRTSAAPAVAPVPLAELPPALARALAGIRDDGLREQVCTAASTAMARRGVQNDDS